MLFFVCRCSRTAAGKLIACVMCMHDITKQTIAPYHVDRARGGQLSAVKSTEPIVPASPAVKEIPGPFDTPKKTTKSVNL